MNGDVVMTLATGLAEATAALRREGQWDLEAASTICDLW
jgi:hypothetical protein